MLVSDCRKRHSCRDLLEPSWWCAELNELLRQLFHVNTLAKSGEECPICHEDMLSRLQSSQDIELRSEVTDCQYEYNMGTALCECWCESKSSG